MVDMENTHPAPPLLTRAMIVAAARLWLGTPYQHQASLCGVGSDCLGLLRGVWRDVTGPEPEPMRPYGAGWAELTGEESLFDLAQKYFVQRPDCTLLPGAVLLFRWQPHLPVKHCGIATGEARFIHAHDGASVAEVTLAPGWRRRIVAAFDFPTVTD